MKSEEKRTEAHRMSSLEPPALPAPQYIEKEKIGRDSGPVFPLLPGLSKYNLNVAFSAFPERPAALH